MIRILKITPDNLICFIKETYVNGSFVQRCKQEQGLQIGSSKVDVRGAFNKFPDFFCTGI